MGRLGEKPSRKEEEHELKWKGASVEANVAGARGFGRLARWPWVLSDPRWGVVAVCTPSTDPAQLSGSCDFFIQSWLNVCVVFAVFCKGSLVLSCVRSCFSGHEQAKMG